ncbi:alpha/beta fold hydrolase [Alkalihalobacterium chitinilyticum]|uniref:Alpha/beta hydrolase n=1 Tax=Alkalihalobacterium chitinilyticum TaxID=2980103 RepID=A0ABT5VMR2_9BACI|nr:alpha/beta hydrolase [Alkalihalobacterium chitinilyticum]MDE5416067.1 alpha/beta hydrolase [Alkalihalobacterium chitinilyticum]
MKRWLEPVFKDKKGFQRIYVDLPWHGQSACKDIVSTEGIRQLLTSYITELLGDQTFSIIGHSYGGYIAQGLISDQTKGLCLLAPATHQKERNVPKKTVFNRNETALTQVSLEIRTAFETLMVYQSAANLQLFIDEIQPGRLLADRAFLTSNWRDAGYFFKADPLAKPYNGRSLLIAGKFDSICGYKDFYRLYEYLPDSTFTILQAGHLLQIEQRETVQFLIGEWLVEL